MIIFKKLTSDKPVIEYIVQQIKARLEKNQIVLWLVAGGSAMDVALKVSDGLKGSPNHDKLAITLTDERYGPVGHADSNWRQLEEKLFSVDGARMLPVLESKSLEETATDYSDFLQKEIDNAEFSIALAGMGADGHIFGIKPGSPAIDSQLDVQGYEWDDYVRLTPTLKLLKNLDETVMYVVGDEKHSQIDDLAKDLPANVQPAQQLKQFKNVIFFNDYKGEPT
ncbi:6-phosphogluconolactonase [Candidatus Saccharibacteria bacterium]|nr:6-phosphogluconolactonase [Candidatus Saccharibacteria bacterium]